MAHADYECCAICDDKMSPGDWETEPKTVLCTSCAVRLAKKGHYITCVDELLEWMRKTPNAVEILDSIGFKQCYYKNDVDDLYLQLKRGKQND